MAQAIKTDKEAETHHFFKLSMALAQALRGTDPEALFEAHDELKVLALHTALPSIKARAAGLVAQHGSDARLVAHEGARLKAAKAGLAKAMQTGAHEDALGSLCVIEDLAECAVDPANRVDAQAVLDALAGLYATPSQSRH